MELFYPDIKVTLGGYTFDTGVRIEAYSGRDSHTDWAKVSFTKQFKEKLSLAALDAATISLGYDGVLYPVFTGRVAKSYDDAGAANEIELKDDMLLLARTEINNTFLDAAAQDIISYTLGMAGVAASKLAESPSRRRPRVPVFKKNGVAVINEVGALWGVSHPFFFLDGVFYWGTKPEQSEVYTFTHAQNIINLDRQGGLWMLETVSVPFIKHSQMINVEHPQVSGTFEVARVLYSTNESGFIRTLIYF